jgi:AcrR family transcriptional regulator
VSERRQAILDVALELFLDEEQDATIEEICRRSGASNGSVYHHFGSKDGIAAELTARFLADYQEGFVAALEEGGVRAAVAHHLRWVTAHPDQARFLLRFGTGGERVAAQNRAFYAEVESWVARHDLRELPLDVRAAILIGPAQEVSRAWLDGRSKTRPDEAADALGEAAWRALKP